MSVWAILVAAGRGERLGLDRPKAFAKLGEEPLLAEPLRRLDASPWVDGIVLVAPPGWEEPAILLAEEEGCDKVHACVTGGETRSDSVRAGLAEVVRNLALRDREKGLSTGEKQMFVKAKKILASELMYAKDMDEETCADWLEEVLASDSPPKKKPAAKKKVAAAAA